MASMTVVCDVERRTLSSNARKQSIAKEEGEKRNLASCHEEFDVTDLVQKGDSNSEVLLTVEAIINSGMLLVSTGLKYSQAIMSQVFGFSIMFLATKLWNYTDMVARPRVRGASSFAPSEETSWSKQAVTGRRLFGAGPAIGALAGAGTGFWLCEPRSLVEMEFVDMSTMSSVDAPWRRRTATESRCRRRRVGGRGARIGGNEGRPGCRNTVGPMAASPSWPARVNGGPE
jgi:hypothetical protein